MDTGTGNKKMIPGGITVKIHACGAGKAHDAVFQSQGRFVIDRDPVSTGHTEAVIGQVFVNP